MLGVKYCGTFTDHSGYGSANRAFITALHLSGVDVTTELVVQVIERSYHGWTGELAQHLIDRTIPYNIKVIHLTPDMYPRYMEKGKYNIGHLFWETDRLPSKWIEPINQMDEIWTSSSAMKELFIANGIKVPIYYFPQPVDTAEADKPYQKYSIPEHKGYLFYSVFQWIERKNPKALLQAYWEAFEGRTDVSLLLKTYRLNYSKEEYEKIRFDIDRYKRETKVKQFPRVLLTTKLLRHEDMMRLHATGDCYVSADHGEGWCRPLQEALNFGKPAITTARGGIHEYLSRDYYYPIRSTYVPVQAQPWIPWYGEQQQWAEPDKEELKATMLYAFSNQIQAVAKGRKAKEFMQRDFSYQKIGAAMKARLETINKKL